MDMAPLLNMRTVSVICLSVCLSVWRDSVRSDNTCQPLLFRYKLMQLYLIIQVSTTSFSTNTEHTIRHVEHQTIGDIWAYGANEVNEGIWDNGDNHQHLAELDLKESG